MLHAGRKASFLDERATADEPLEEMQRRVGGLEADQVQGVTVSLQRGHRVDDVRRVVARRLAVADQDDGAVANMLASKRRVGEVEPGGDPRATLQRGPRARREAEVAVPRRDRHEQACPGLAAPPRRAAGSSSRAGVPGGSSSYAESENPTSPIGFPAATILRSALTISLYEPPVMLYEKSITTTLVPFAGRYAASVTPPPRATAS